MKGSKNDFSDINFHKFESFGGCLDRALPQIRATDFRQGIFAGDNYRLGYMAFLLFYKNQVLSVSIFYFSLNT